MGKASLTDAWKRYSGQDYRRSSRVEWNLPLLVYGQDKNGENFVEKTTAIDLNLHGCGFPSRHDCLPGCYVTLRFGGKSLTREHKIIRAQVKRSQVPANSQNLYRIGVELDIPGNVWCVSPLPLDWRRFLGAKSPAELTIAPAFRAASSLTFELPANSQPDISSPPAPFSIQTSLAAIRTAQAKPRDSEQHSLGPTPAVFPQPSSESLPAPLAQWVEDEVRAALARHLEPALARALFSLEEQTRAGTQQLQDAVVHQQDGTRIEAIVQRFEQLAASAQQNLAAAKEMVERATQGSAQRLEEQVSLAVERATLLIDEQSARSTNRHLVRLSEDAHAVAREANSIIDANSAAVRAEMQAALRLILDEFRRQAEIHAVMISADTTQKVTSALTALDAEHRALHEARRKSVESEVNQVGANVTQEFRQSLKTFFYSCLVAAVGAVEEHSKITLDGLSPDSKKWSLPEL